MDRYVIGKDSKMLQQKLGSGYMDIYDNILSTFLRLKVFITNIGEKKKTPEIQTQVYFFSFFAAPFDM